MCFLQKKIATDSELEISFREKVMPALTLLPIQRWQQSSHSHSIGVGRRVPERSKAAGHWLQLGPHRVFNWKKYVVQVHISM